MTPSKVWFGISALAFVGVLTVSWRQRDRKGPSSNAAWMAETLMKYGFPG